MDDMRRRLRVFVVFDDALLRWRLRVEESVGEGEGDDSGAIPANRPDLRTDITGEEAGRGARVDF
jgi:hypothetical protein